MNKSIHVSRLLVLACSATKLDQPGTMPAINRYNGPAYKIVRPWYAARTDASVRVLILSARYGLIDPSKPIENYDQQFKPIDAHNDAILPATGDGGIYYNPNQIITGLQIRELGALLECGAWRDLLFFGSELYATIFDRVLERAGGCDVLYRKTAGGIGEQLRELKTWCAAAVAA